MPVYKDEERGTWCVRCYYEDFTEKKKQIKKRGFKLQREAKEWEADFLRKQKGSTDMTFRSMYEIYIEDMGHRCRQSTVDGKKHVFEELILPYFENKPINKITPKDIRAWQNEMIAKDYSNSYLDRMFKFYDLKDTDRVFPFTKSYINNAMARACKKSGVKKIRIHDIRHSHASYLINLGCAALLISERLGHEKVQTTLSTYSHLYPNKHQEVVDMMQSQHKLETVTAGAYETSDKPEKDPQPQNTRFKVVSPKDKISPQQVHKNDLSPCVGFAERT